MAAADWEYNILQMAAGRSAHMSDRINQLGEEGFEPYMLVGDTTITLLMRRPKQEAQTPPAPQPEP
jgi:hypothetical protein